MTGELDLGPTSADWLPGIAQQPETVKRLVQENRTLRDRLTRMEDGHRAEVRALKAQLQEALSPELVALRKEVSRLRQRAIATEGREREAGRRDVSAR